MATPLDMLWHMRGSTSLGSAHDRAIGRLADMLKRQHKRVSDRGPDFVAFDAPLWTLGPNWLAMVIYDRGRFWIERDGEGRHRLRYELRSLHGFVFCLGFAGVALLFSALAGDWLRAAAMAALMFGWLYGMNIVLAYARIPGLIRRTANGG